jgi:Zn-dependent protease
VAAPRGLGLCLDVRRPADTNLVVEIVFYFALVNLLLGLFNLLPIPPLDGRPCSSGSSRAAPAHLVSGAALRLLAMFVIVFWVPA